MKKNIFRTLLIMFVFSVISCLGFSGCSNSEDLSNDVTPENDMGHVSFKITEKDFELGEEIAGTRAAAQPQPELQDLGDGVMAEVSLVPDTTHRVQNKAATRAIYTPTHYTIQAYQGSVKKGELKGTFNGSTFTPDTGQPKSMNLPHGTYDFVCFNDKVMANGTQYTVNRADAGTARFTVKRGVVINQDPKQYVAFEMKYAGANIWVSLSYANFSIEMVATHLSGSGLFPQAEYQANNPAERVKTSMESLPGSIPETMIYDFSTDTYTYPSLGTQTPTTPWEIGASALNQMLGHKMFVNSNYSSGDVFCLPTTDCANFKLTFTFGEFYGHSLAGKSITIPTHKQVEINKQYHVVVNLLLSPTYLFSDGTTGALTPGKTPVGVVLDPYQKIAVALNDVTSAFGGSNLQWASYSSRESSNPATNYKDLFDKYESLNSKGTVNYISSSAAMSAARGYYQTVGFGNSFGSNQVWYVPSVKEFLLMGVSLGRLPHRTPGDMMSETGYNYLIPSNAPATGFTGTFPQFPTMDMTRFNKAFTDAGGIAPSGTYWTSTECQDGSDYKQGIIDVNGAGYSFFLSSKTASSKVRPFIHY